MQPPDALIRAGINQPAQVGDGRQSGKLGKPVDPRIRLTPEAAVGGGLCAFLQKPATA